MDRNNTQNRNRASTANHMKELVGNALDFLALATDEFKARPKHSIVAFHTSVELFLKARLMHEHWSLVVGKAPDRDSFATGDFVSVTFEEACQRLAKVVGSPLPDSTRESFYVIRRHRSRTVHFFQDLADPAMREQLAVEQLTAWHSLCGLLQGEWHDVFAPFNLDLDTLDRTFAGHRLYLKTRFDSLTPTLAALKAAGSTLTTCALCRFEAAEVGTAHAELQQARCRVCGFSSRWLKLPCTNCKATFTARGEEETSCECGASFRPDEIAEMVDDDPATPDDYFGHLTPANCSTCDGYRSVVSFREKYLCVACLELSDGLSVCGWCNEGNNGDLEGSSWKGCNFCEGRAGWDRD